MEQTQAYIVDLTKIVGNGDFPCPRCGNVISPDKTTEETYSIIEQKSIITVWRKWFFAAINVRAKFT